MSFDAKKWKALFGYTDHWFAEGFLGEEFLAKQAAAYRCGEDRDVEHFKWAAYQAVLDALDPSDRDRFRAFVSVMEADPNEHLYKGAITHLVKVKGVPPVWFLEFEGARFLSQESVRKTLGLDRQ